VKGVYLSPAGARVPEISVLTVGLGERVGVHGVLDDLNRSAKVTEVPGSAPVWGFRWDDEDSRSQRWFPQGITSSADGSDTEHVDGHRALCTSWYSQDVDGVNKGSRLTFVDVTDQDHPRYRHVLLVRPVLRADGRVDVVPVQIHAGGIAWYGSHLLVTGTFLGISTFRLDDILRVEPGADSGSLGIHDDGHLDSFGYRYVLPVRGTYQARADDGVASLRHSFLSLDRTARPHRMTAGEYGTHATSTRLVSYELDASTSLLSTRDDGRVRPVSIYDGVSAMQGATVVDGTYYVTTSAGRYGRGSLWVGSRGRWRKHPHVLPVGPEDVTYWPSTGQLWSLTEYPGRRYVFAMNLCDFG